MGPVEVDLIVLLLTVPLLLLTFDADAACRDRGVGSSGSADAVPLWCGPAVMPPPRNPPFSDVPLWCGPAVALSDDPDASPTMSSTAERECDELE